MKTSIQIAIIGSRTFSDYHTFSKKCTSILSNLTSFTIISGGARGTDTMAERYASENNIPILIYRADWDNDGKSAGMKRNMAMLNDSTHVIAFWDSKSSGTRHMIYNAQHQHLKIRIILI